MEELTKRELIEKCLPQQKILSTQETINITRKTVLQKAEKCVCGDREQDYGSPEDNFKTIAELWTTYVKRKCICDNVDVCISAEDVAVMMTLLKIARIAGGNFKEDSWVDAIGYLACGGEIAGK